MARGKMLSASGLAGPSGRTFFPFPDNDPVMHQAPYNVHGVGSSYNAFNGARGKSSFAGMLGRSLFFANLTSTGGAGTPIGEKMSGKDINMGRLTGPIQ